MQGVCYSKSGTESNRAGATIPVRSQNGTEKACPSRRHAGQAIAYRDEMVPDRQSGKSIYPMCFCPSSFSQKSSTTQPVASI